MAEGNFIDCLKIILNYEGGYTNNLNDKGRETNFGITQSVYNSYRSLKGNVWQSVKLISQDEVEEVYRINYWDAVKANELSIGVDLLVFNASVNHGVKRASLFLQKVAGVTTDGIIGDLTIGKANLMPSNILITNYIKLESDFYNEIVSNNPSQLVFLNGWMNRLNDVNSRATAMLLA